MLSQFPNFITCFGESFYAKRASLPGKLLSQNVCPKWLLCEITYGVRLNIENNPKQSDVQPQYERFGYNNDRPETSFGQKMNWSEHASLPIHPERRIDLASPRTH
jgi:hypothetical protein